MSAMNRKTFLKQVARGATGAALLAAGVPAAASTGPATGRRVLRLAHFTDVHVRPLPEAMEGFRAALRHVQALEDRPDGILFGGDLIHDALSAEKAAALAQWDCWERIVAEELRLPHWCCLGNHDVWGWDLDDPPFKSDPLYGKAMALGRLGMKDRYYSFDLAGWHIVVLDSVHPRPGGESGYLARLDDAQFDWLAGNLAAMGTDRPVLVLSHMPILGVSGFFGREREATGNWVIPGNLVHIDARRIKDLFHRHPNVRACLSGHIHLVDEAAYLGVRYFCNGAVCGRWWRGPNQEFGPAYALVDLYDDGTVRNELVCYQS
jgi:Icc protein